MIQGGVYVCVCLSECALGGLWRRAERDYRCDVGSCLKRVGRRFHLLGLRSWRSDIISLFLHIWMSRGTLSIRCFCGKRFIKSRHSMGLCHLMSITHYRAILQTNDVQRQGILWVFANLCEYGKSTERSRKMLIFVNESCIYDWVMLHVRISHVTHMIELCHLKALTAIQRSEQYLFLCMGHVTNIWMSHGTHAHKSRHNYKWFMSQV